MIIQEMVERECCEQGKDLKTYKGLSAISKTCFFCIHCGQVWFFNDQDILTRIVAKKNGDVML